jgi:hypothetical protein
LDRSNSVLNGPRGRTAAERTWGEFIDPDDAEQLLQARLRGGGRRSGSASPQTFNAEPDSDAAWAPAPPGVAGATGAASSTLTSEPGPEVAADPANQEARVQRASGEGGGSAFEFAGDGESWLDNLASPMPTPTLAPAAAPTWQATAPHLVIELDTDSSQTQLSFNTSQQAFVPPAAPAAASSANPAALVVAPAPGYVGERPADATWLLNREAALIAVRDDYCALLAQAQTQVPTISATGSRAGPGWSAIGMRFDSRRIWGQVFHFVSR